MSNKASGRAFARDVLKNDFEQAGLGLKLLEAPLEASNSDIFQMDIHETKRSGEYFRIWPGAQTNEVEVLGQDHRRRQLVLRLKEPKRPYTQTVALSDRLTKADVLQELRSEGGHLVREKKDLVVVRRWTSPMERRYLCGLDDIHLFIAQIQWGKTVSEAHRALKPGSVIEAERRWPESVVRQGEWFFVPLTLEERTKLLARINAHPHEVSKKKSVGTGAEARPHVADQVVRMTRWKRIGFRAFGVETVYARGAIRHVDHRPLVVDDWRKVVRNNDASVSKESRMRIKWID